MKTHPKHQGPRQNLSSYFSHEQVEQQLFGEDSEIITNMEDNGTMDNHKQNGSRQTPKAMTNHQRHLKTNNNSILQHFYNPEESDNEEQQVPRDKNQTQPTYSNGLYQKNPPQQHNRSKKPCSTPRPVQLEQQFPPMYPNPYQFFPFYPPFFSPYTAGLTEESIKEHSKKTEKGESFYSDKSMSESSIFFEKNNNIEILLSESREMRQIIQSQSETIEQILKKLEEVSMKMENITNREFLTHGIQKVNTRDSEEPQPHQPPLNASNQFFTQTPCTSNKSSTTTIPSTVSTSYKNLASNMTPPSKFLNRSQINESMTNNTSGTNQKIQNSSVLDKSTNKSDHAHSNRYSISPTISNSPIRSIGSQSTRMNASLSSKKSGNSHTSSSNFNSDASQNFEEKLVKSPSYSASMKDMGSPVKSVKSDKLRRSNLNEESFLSASQLSESMDLLADTHGDDSFVYNASYMSSYSSTPLEPFSTEMQKYVKEKILTASKKEDIAKDSENTYATGSKKKKDFISQNYSSSSFPIKSFSKI